jgi:UDP-2,3-diacylglucosamine pyrophosphatase LpxH
MQMSFDLISDLHLDDNLYDCSGMATSSICVVAGDIAEDRISVVNFLNRLSKCYQQVLYIDGNAEHKHYLLDLESSHLDLKYHIAKLNRVQYLYDDVVVINGVAFIGTNGWWGFDFDSYIDSDQSAQWYRSVMPYPCNTDQIVLQSINDAAYLAHTVEKLQTHPEVKQIIIVSHTVPVPELIAHDVDLEASYKFNVMGNRLLDAVRMVDTELKISTWCFGHYHGAVDQHINGIRYVNNCRGRSGTQHWQYAYYPKKITVDI